jgi:hypothetical protein
VKIDTIVIPRRFRGPPNSANGGYACGRLAAFIEGAAEVTLRRPPPLEKALAVTRHDDGSVSLLDGDQLVATARPAEITVPADRSPTFEQARAATGRTFDPSLHKLPMCFVCGPDREPGDGLRIFCGPLDPADTEWSGPVAAPWTPAAFTAGDDGAVRDEFVWAALDCPTAFAAGSAAGFPIILLGRQTVQLVRRPDAGEKCVITARLTGREGRKYFACATLFGADGAAIAACKAVWIEVERTVQLGKSHRRA